MKKRTVFYKGLDYAGNGEETSFDVQYDELPRLPKGGTNQDIFEAAIYECATSEVKNVLVDVYRFLLDGNFASQRPGSGDLNENYPSAGAITWTASQPFVGHPSGKTNTLGAVLYLLLSWKGPQEIKLTLGGLLVAMLDHPHYKKIGMPVIQVK